MPKKYVMLFLRNELIIIKNERRTFAQITQNSVSTPRRTNTLSSALQNMCMFH